MVCMGVIVDIIVQTIHTALWKIDLAHVQANQKHLVALVPNSVLEPVHGLMHQQNRIHVRVSTRPVVLEPVHGQQDQKLLHVLVLTS